MISNREKKEKRAEPYFKYFSRVFLLLIKFLLRLRISNETIIRSFSRYIYISQPGLKQNSRYYAENKGKKTQVLMPLSKTYIFRRHFTNENLRVFFNRLFN